MKPGLSAVTGLCSNGIVSLPEKCVDITWKCNQLSINALAFFQDSDRLFMPDGTAEYFIHGWENSWALLFS